MAGTRHQLEAGEGSSSVVDCLFRAAKLRSQIIRLQVEAAYCNGYGGGFRLQIIDGRVYVAGERPGFQDRHRNLKLLLLHLQGVHALPNVDIGFFTSGEVSIMQITMVYVTSKDTLELRRGPARR